MERMHIPPAAQDLLSSRPLKLMSRKMNFDVLNMDFSFVFQKNIDPHRPNWQSQ
jgi:hypothetical protein